MPKNRPIFLKGWWSLVIGVSDASASMFSQDRVDHVPPACLKHIMNALDDDERNALYKGKSTFVCLLASDALTDALSWCQDGARCALYDIQRTGTQAELECFQRTAHRCKSCKGACSDPPSPWRCAVR